MNQPGVEIERQLHVLKQKTSKYLIGLQKIEDFNQNLKLYKPYKMNPKVGPCHASLICFTL